MFCPSSDSRLTLLRHSYVLGFRSEPELVIWCGRSMAGKEERCRTWSVGAERAKRSETRSCVACLFWNYRPGRFIGDDGQQVKQADCCHEIVALIGG